MTDADTGSRLVTLSAAKWMDDRLARRATVV